MEPESPSPLPPRDALRELLARVRDGWGLTHIRRAAPAPKAATIRAGARAARPSSTSAGPAAPHPSAPRIPRAPSVELAADAPDSERDRALAAIAREVQACRACRLCEKRKLAVPGEGSAIARVAFVGEAPGFDEDRSGRPFVGAAGHMLTSIIERGMRLDRRSVWIGNTVKCRPPGNRNPEPDEIQACEPFLRRQLDIVRPAVIVTLGRFASQLLTGRTEGILSLRGKVYAAPSTWEVAGTPVVPTVHPSFLLRSPEFKPQCWEDIQLAMKQIGLEPLAPAQTQREPEA